MTETYFWENWKQHPESIQEEMLSEIEKMLPELTWKAQADTFQGAPGQVILRFLSSLAWEAQVKAYNEYLPVGSREGALPLLHHRAKIRLGLAKREGKKLKAMC